MKLSKKFAAILLALLLFLTVLPVALAAEGEGEGTPVDTTAPMDTTGSTDSTNPADPSNPAEPTNPADPSDPTEPANPTDPSDPTEPSDPTDPSDPTEPSDPTDPSEPETDPTEPETTEPTEPEETQPVYRPRPTDPTEPKVNTDYAGLNRQIAIANGLKEREYTQESWKVLVAALETARNAQKSDKQDVVDSAADALMQAIAELVTMDYSDLEKALTAAKECVGPEEYELVIQLHEAVAEAELLRSSGDQDAVDACAEKIYDLIRKLEECLADVAEPSVVIREVEVEVPPSEDYCNISLHHTWPLLFFASVGLNVALLVVIFSVLRRRKRRGEDVPLVNYDIDDDF